MSLKSFLLVISSPVLLIGCVAGHPKFGKIPGLSQLASQSDNPDNTVMSNCTKSAVQGTKYTCQVMESGQSGDGGMSIAFAQGHSCSWINGSGTSLYGTPNEIGSCVLSVTVTDSRGEDHPLRLEIAVQGPVVPEPKPEPSINCTEGEWVSHDQNGFGTEESPFLICSEAQLRDLSAKCTPNGCDGSYQMGQDIAVSGDPFPPIGGQDGAVFNGDFDGNGYKITNLIVRNDASANTGFFGRVGQSGIVRNLGLVDVTVYGLSNSGAIVGTLNGVVNNVSVSGTASRVTSLGDSTNLGGIVGLVQGGSAQIVEAKWLGAGRIEGVNQVGGVVGAVINGSIETSHSAARVIGANLVGGVFGYARDAKKLEQLAFGGRVEGKPGSDGSFCGGVAGRIIDSTPLMFSKFTGQVDCNKSSKVGGLAGGTNAKIIQSYSSGTIKGVQYVGGLIGMMKSPGGLENCYSHSDVGGKFKVGGLIGEVGEGTNFIDTSYFSGQLSANDEPGCLSGNHFGQISQIRQVYWLSSACSNGTSGKGNHLEKPDDDQQGAISGISRGLTEAELKDPKNYGAKWDFNGVWMPYKNPPALPTLKNTP